MLDMPQQKVSAAEVGGGGGGHKNPYSLRRWYEKQESDGILTRSAKFTKISRAKRTGWKEFNKLKGGSVAVQFP